MNVVAIIPAHMASTRLPGKPMARIHGIPMIGHVYLRTSRSEGLTATYVATCDKEIFDYIKSIGGKAVMTADTHLRCTDRTAEAMLKIEEEVGTKVDVVVMVQGDEPMVVPEMITESLKPLMEDPSLQVVNLMGIIDNALDFEDKNVVKVVVDKSGNALYFSREPIPSRKFSKMDYPKYYQVPIIPFRRDFLLEFGQMPPTPLEKIESVDMLRILEHGGRIKMVPTRYSTIGVDTQEDLEVVTEIMSRDSLMRSYSGFPHPSM